MAKDLMVIVEGPQGCGKTTVTNWLRENLLFSNLYRMSGHKDPTESGLRKSLQMYGALMDYLISMRGSGINLIFDRTFLSELLYCRLGFRNYSFEDAFQRYMMTYNEGLTDDYDIYVINLYLYDTNIFEKRLGGSDRSDKKGHHGSKFNVENSINQQKTYSAIMNEIENKYPNIKVRDIRMDDGRWEDILKEMFKEWLK